MKNTYEIKGNTREGMIVYAKDLASAIDQLFAEHRIFKVLWKLNVASISYDDDNAVLKIKLPYAEIKYTITKVDKWIKTEH